MRARSTILGLVLSKHGRSGNGSECFCRVPAPSPARQQNARPPRWKSIVSPGTFTGKLHFDQLQKRSAGTAPRRMQGKHATGSRCPRTQAGAQPEAGLLFKSLFQASATSRIAFYSPLGTFTKTFPICPKQSKRRVWALEKIQTDDSEGGKVSNLLGLPGIAALSVWTSGLRHHVPLISTPKAVGRVP